MRRILRKAVQGSGVANDTLEVDSVTSALDAADTFQFECAIVDESLAGDSGIGAIDQLRTRRPSAKYILFSSSLTMGVQTVGSTDNVFVLPKTFTQESMQNALAFGITSN
jgi:Response regulator receiver domain.